MGIASQGNIIRILSGHNLWWQMKAVQKQFLKPTKRTAFREIMNLVHGGQIRTIYAVGPHRTGKTALLHQIVQQLIDEGVDPKEILYINFLHPFFNFLSLNDFYAAYNENIRPYETHRIYLLIDDYQLSPEWEKRIAQLSKENPELTIIASGSILPEKLPDNSRQVNITPLSLYEYTQIALGEEKIAPDDIIPECGVLKGSPAELSRISKHVAKFRQEYTRYLYTGGFLNLIGVSDDIKIQRMIQKSVVGSAMQDIGRCFNVRSSVDMEKIFLYLCFQCPSVVSFEAVMRDIDCVTRPTIEKYVQYLEKSCLLYQCMPYEFNNDNVQKVQPKIYLADAAITSSLLMMDDVRIREDAVSKIVETAVYRHLRFFGPYSDEGSITYQRGKGSGKNIDMILNGPRRIFIDVRYENEIRFSRKDSILAKSSEADLGLIITKPGGKFGFSSSLPENVFCIPANIFLFLIGHAKAEEKSFLDGILMAFRYY